MAYITSICLHPFYHIVTNLEELNSCELKNQFVYGEKTAYVECLQIIMLWDRSPIKQSNIDLEKKYL